MSTPVLHSVRPQEPQLREAEGRFQDLVDAVVDYAIFLLDEGGHIATWNPGAKRLKGYSAEDIIGKHFSTFYTAADREAGKPAYILDTVREQGRFEDEGWRVRKDGSRFWANVVITALRDGAGKLIGFAKVTRDLTARRAAEEELRRSEERFRLLLENISDYAVYMLDPVGRVSTWNLGAERMKGYAPHEIIGHNFLKFFPEEDRVSGKPERELAIACEWGRYEDEGWRIRKDGSRFWANAILTALRDSNGVVIGFAKITRDLSAKREAEDNERRLLLERAARESAEASQRQLRDAVKQAEEASRAKDEFLATVSHELRTPLNAILGWATLLKEGDLEPNIARPIDVIHRNAQAQVRIIDDILDVSRVITGKLRLEVKPVDVVTIARDTIEAVRSSADAKNITIDFQPSSEGCLMVGDPERLQQVAWNLLSNAVKFTEANGFVRVSVRQEGSEVVLDVSDTGRGIAQEFLPHVFERFRQADSTSTRKVGGLGLGLALVRHIVELHGGRISVTSEGEGKGAAFTVVLPIRAVVPAPVAAAPRETPTPAPARTRVSLMDLRVLVVDDEHDARELLAEVLKQAGAQVETAPSAAEGYELFKRFHPDILLSDIAMPEEDGFSFVKRVRSLPPGQGGRIPALALTAFTREEDRMKAISHGFTTHLGKPVNPDMLVAAVANLAMVNRA